MGVSSAAVPSIWDEVRRDFPGLAGRVYLNAAATSLTPRPVREAVTAFYRELEQVGDQVNQIGRAHV